jgi:hypothetical protein
MPPWLGERLGWIVIVGMIVFFGLPLKILWNVFGADPPVSEPPTRLVLTFGPAKVWKEGTASHLQSATIKLKNVGDTPALGIQTHVSVRSIHIPLLGPDTLQPGAEASYTGEANVSMRESERLDISFGCINCMAF